MKTMPYNLSIPTTSSVTTALSQTKALNTMFDKNSVALTTNKFVNVSTDNSILYCKDMRLSERAQGLSSVMDGLSNIVSMLNTTADAVESIDKLLSLAKAAANSALDEHAYISKLTGENLTFKTTDKKLNELPDVQTGDKILLRTGDADKMESDFAMNQDMTLKDLNIVEGETLEIKLGNDDWMTLKVIDEDMKVTDFFGQIAEQAPSSNFKYEIKDEKLTISTTDRSSIIMQGSLAEALGFDLSTTFEVTIDDEWSVEQFAREISNVDNNISAAVNKSGNLEVSSIYGDNLVIADYKGKTAQSFGLNGWDDSGFNTAKSYADQYNELLEQINSAVKDSSFNGLNLLEGDSIRAIFDEKGTTFRTVNGVKLDAQSLGLPEALDNWENQDDIKATLDAIEHAANIVRASAAKFSRASAMVQSRETFLSALSETFTVGAETLTGADLNEVSAQILSIQTQKELVNNVLSITLEAQSSVLNLF